MPFDYKKEYKEFYLPPKKPQIITVPAMNFVAVHGKGDPNDPAGEYKAALELLYGIAFTIKMSYKGSHKIDARCRGRGFFQQGDLYLDLHDSSAGICHPCRI